MHLDLQVVQDIQANLDTVVLRATQDIQVQQVVEDIQDQQVTQDRQVLYLRVHLDPQVTQVLQV